MSSVEETMKNVRALAPEERAVLRQLVKDPTIASILSKIFPHMAGKIADYLMKTGTMAGTMPPPTAVPPGVPGGGPPAVGALGGM